jgi:hypothetical protein
MGFTPLGSFCHYRRRYADADLWRPRVLDVALEGEGLHHTIDLCFTHSAELLGENRQPGFLAREDVNIRSGGAVLYHCHRKGTN